MWHMVSLPDDFPTAERRVPIRGAFLGAGSVSLVNQEVSPGRILVRASLDGRRSAFGSAFTKYSGAIMTSRYTSRGVRACERDSISPGPPNKEPLSDQPLG
ncbi:Uncharacterized protein DBV15_10014 [Temnothorax longispinosus]|uniref:Uncharacterized protein n=1 Tax=Temnothorax longispinosus TaxID=300112 RepID=A0A4S2KPW0_9HYME|nr:Uncharacterized protein DBV15_10014 [Temnothorax longispinosus]